MKKRIITVMTILTVALLTGCGGGGPNYPRNGMYIQKSTRTPGAVLARIPFKDGKRNGLVTLYYATGEVGGQGKMVDDKKVGIWKQWDTQGRLSSVEPYVNGMKNGTEKRFHSNGKLASATTYVNGIKNGPQKRFYSNGKWFDTLYWENGNKKLSAKEKRKEKRKEKNLYKNDDAEWLEVHKRYESISRELDKCRKEVIRGEHSFDRCKYIERKLSNYGADAGRAGY